MSGSNKSNILQAWQKAASEVERPRHLQFKKSRIQLSLDIYYLIERFLNEVEEAKISLESNIFENSKIRNSLHLFLESELEHGKQYAEAAFLVEKAFVTQSFEVVSVAQQRQER